MSASSPPQGVFLMCALMHEALTETDTLFQSVLFKEFQSRRSGREEIF